MARLPCIRLHNLYSLAIIPDEDWKPEHLHATRHKETKKALSDHEIYEMNYKKFLRDLV
jgi:hypothetical protein